MDYLNSEKLYIVKFDANLLGGKTENAGLESSERPADLSEPLVSVYGLNSYRRFYTDFYKQMGYVGFSNFQESGCVSRQKITYDRFLHDIGIVADRMSFIHDIEKNPFKSIKMCPVDDFLELGGNVQRPNAVERMCAGEELNFKFNSDRKRRWSLMYDFSDAGQDGNITYGQFDTILARYGFKKVNQNSSMAYSEEELTPKEFSVRLHKMFKENPYLKDVCHSKPHRLRRRDTSFVISDYPEYEMEFSNQFRDMLSAHAIHKPENRPKYDVAEHMMMSLNYDTGQFIVHYADQDEHYYRINLGQSPHNVFANLNMVASDLAAGRGIQGFKYKEITADEYQQNYEANRAALDAVLNTNTKLNRLIDLDVNPSNVFYMAKAIYDDYKFLEKPADAYGLIQLSAEVTDVDLRTYMNNPDMRAWRDDPSNCPACVVSYGGKKGTVAETIEKDMIVSNYMTLPGKPVEEAIDNSQIQKACWAAVMKSDEDLYGKALRMEPPRTDWSDRSRPITYTPRIEDDYGLYTKYQIMTQPAVKRISLTASGKLDEYHVNSLANDFALKLFGKSGRLTQSIVSRKDENSDYRIVMMVPDRRMNAKGMLLRHGSDTSIHRRSYGTVTTYMGFVQSVTGSQKNYFREFILDRWCQFHNIACRQQGLTTEDGMPLQAIPQRQRASFNTFVASMTKEDANYRAKAPELVMDDFYKNRREERSKSIQGR